MPTTSARRCLLVQAFERVRGMMLVALLQPVGIA
jgi:hypothetical protein